jgi:hypothetical protein
MSRPSAADPWRDTDVIDARAPRFNQAVVGIVAVAGILLGWPLLWALMGAQLLIGLTLGRRFCLTCLAYFLLIQPRFGEGELEDSRPPRLANAIGFAVLGAAALAWWLGSPAAGSAIAALVAFLALLAGGPEPLIAFDVRERPDLARKYGIAVVPTVFAVGADGAVLERLAP